MASFYFAYCDDSGYGIIRIETDRLTPAVEAEAERIAILVKRAEAFDSDLVLSEALSFSTDEGPFSFAVEVSPDRQEVSYQVLLEDQLVEDEKLQV